MPPRDRSRACSSLCLAAAPLARARIACLADAAFPGASRLQPRGASPRAPLLRRSARAADWTLRFLLFARGEPLLDVRDQLTGGSARAEKSSDAARLQRFDILFRDDSAAGDQDVIPTRVANEVLHAWDQRHVSPTQNRETDYIDVFLNRRGRDHLGSLMKSSVDDFHSRVTERGGDDFCAAVVSVEARFGDEYSNWSHCGIKVSGNVE